LTEPYHIILKAPTRHTSQAEQSAHILRHPLSASQLCCKATTTALEKERNPASFGEERVGLTEKTQVLGCRIGFVNDLVVCATPDNGCECQQAFFCADSSSKPRSGALLCRSYLLPHLFEGLVRLRDKATHLVETDGVRHTIDCEGYFYTLRPQLCL